MLKKVFKVCGLLTILTSLFTSCEISFELNLSGNSSSSQSNIDTSYGSIMVENTTGDTITKNNFKFENASASIGSNGFVIAGSSSYYILGGGEKEGSINIEFETPITIDSIELFAYSYETNDFESNVNYNNSSFAVTYSKNNTFLKEFTSPINLESVTLNSNGNGSRIKFEGIKVHYANDIAVTGINTLKDVEVEVNRSIYLSDCYEVLPSNATNKNVTLSCSSSFVEIDGLRIKCNNVGDYVVKATTVDGNFSTDINITATASVIEDGFKKLLKDDIRFDYDEIFSPDDWEGIIPSVGAPNILVVPVNFSDLVGIYNFKNTESINKLNAAFNGTNSDYTNSYSHSLRSFYRESSYGALDMNFIITDVFTPSFTSSSFINKEKEYDGGGTYQILEEFYNSGKINGQSINFKDKKYDLNNDGFVDGIWLIYNDNRSSTKNSYWPYTYWYYTTDNEGNILRGGPNISCYANCSVYFTFEDSTKGEDYHTLVHETGHMLGLDDYYVTTSTSITSAIGGLDMMDYNIGDHNAFSKFSLKWIEPYIVEDVGTITLSPFQENGDALIIPSSYFNDSAFSEYLIIEYYTPTGLNVLDATNRYPSRNYYFTENGIRIFHVDARLMGLDENFEFNGKFLDEDATSIPSDAYAYQCIGSNTPSYSYNNTHLIEAITKDNRKTYNGDETNNSSLFKAGDKFDPSKYTKFFTNSKFHDGSSINYIIEFVSMDDNGCEIKITLK